MIRSMIADLSDLELVAVIMLGAVIGVAVAELTGVWPTGSSSAVGSITVLLGVFLGWAEEEVKKQRGSGESGTKGESHR